MPAARLLAGLCGASAGIGCFLVLRTVAGRVSLGQPSRWLQAGAAWLNGQVTGTAGPERGRRILLADEIAIAGRDPAAHTASRVAHATGLAILAALLAAAAAAMGLPMPVLVGPVAVLLAAFAGVTLADRPVRRLATQRRQETKLAVAAYLELVRVLLASGLPLHAVLRLAADAGHGWAFGQIRAALATSAARNQSPDAGLDELAGRVPLPELRELRLTITSALRGASPVEAMDSKATHLRASEAADARAEAATADAELELPAAAVALVFVGFLTYPLLAVLSSSGLT
ncbi:type II secretion system F family protein [Frankia sp. AgB1.9]|nr:type II secretion system F family protein [Frankia sp. AgW1.1]MBL7551043.1 type II secretion system F family protein [Frankia sp. AgB1.9]MBL7618824.1 type II secretion system F family protein [Frankia sp. AgB1.8]